MKKDNSSHRELRPAVGCLLFPNFEKYLHSCTIYSVGKIMFHPPLEIFARILDEWKAPI